GSARSPPAGVHFSLAKPPRSMLGARHPAGRVSCSRREAGMMRRVGWASLVFAVAFMWSSEVLANTVTQNVSWTIDRAGTSAKYHVDGHGDSIYVGYHGYTCAVTIWSAPNVSRQYGRTVWPRYSDFIRG